MESFLDLFIAKLTFFKIARVRMSFSSIKTHLRVCLHLLKNHPHGRIAHDLLNLGVVHGIPSHL